MNWTCHSAAFRPAIVALFAALCALVFTPATAGAVDVEVAISALFLGDEAPTISVTMEGAETLTQEIAPETSATFDVAPGVWTVMASAPGFDAWSATVDIDRATTVSGVLYPAADVRVFGLVTAAEGGPVEGATVRVSGERSPTPRTAETTADGAYEVEVPAGIYTVSVSSSGMGVSVTDVSALADAELNVVIPRSSEAPEVTEKRSLSCAAGGNPMALFGLVWAAFAMRRRCR